jgi:CRISPR-associated protein Csm2
MAKKNWQGHKKQEDPCKNRQKYTKEELQKILDGKAPQKLVNLARTIARDELLGSSGEVSTSQIRNIFGTVKKLEMRSDENVIPELILLKPKLAYAAGRHKIPGMKCLRDILSEALDLVAEKKDRFVNFCRFFEAILAYHKAEGGK